MPIARFYKAITFKSSLSYLSPELQYPKLFQDPFDSIIKIEQEFAEKQHGIAFYRLEQLLHRKLI